MLNIGIGLVLGALVVWFLIGPANTQRINRQADEKVVEYSGKMASQEAQLNQLQSQVDSLNETTASAQQQIQTAQDTAASYENLLKAVEAQFFLLFHMQTGYFPTQDRHTDGLHR